MFQAFGPQHWWPGDTPFEIMVGAILTQNTNWQNARRAIERIKDAGLMEPRQMLARHRRIPKLIRPAGFYRAKSRCLRAFLNYYVGTYGGRTAAVAARPTPALRHELLALPGIGPETADAMLLYALGRRVFVIDAYTRRIFGRHNMVEPDLPYDTLRRMVEQDLPRSLRLYNEYHALLVRTGKEYCKKDDPECDPCPLRPMLGRL